MHTNGIRITQSRNGRWFLSYGGTIVGKRYGYLSQGIAISAKYELEKYGRSRAA